MKVHVHIKEISELNDDYDLTDEEIKYIKSSGLEYFENDLDNFGNFESEFEITDENGNNIVEW